MHISVIGAGISGLAISALLAKAGHQVHIFEKNSQIGGRARVWKHNGFTFDMGPSWYLMPEVYENFFSNFSKSISDFYKLKQLDPGYRIFLKNHQVDISPDMKANEKTFDQLEPNGSQKLKAYLEHAKKQYNYSLQSNAMLTSFDSPKDYLNKKFLLNVKHLDLIHDFYSILSKYFVSETAKNVAAYATIFLGADPRKMPALFSMLSYIDYHQGVWYPMGGISKVVGALEEICKLQHVEVHTSSPVQSIKVTNSTATCVIVNNKNISTDLVISAADYRYCETQLLEPKYQSYPESYWKNRVMTPSAFVVYLGLNKRLKTLQHHNAFLHNGWESHFNQIFQNPVWPQNPAYYVCCPAITDPSVAPAGKENVFITIPISTALIDTPQARKTYFEYILTDLERRTGETIKDAIEFNRIFCKKDFVNEYNAFQGTALGPAPIHKQSGFFSPKHQSKKIQNLFYVGQYTHPGSGMPAVIHSAQIVATKVQSKYASSTA